MDLERCDPLVFEELVEFLEERQKAEERQRMEQELKARMGR